MTIHVRCGVLRGWEYTFVLYQAYTDTFNMYIHNTWFMYVTIHGLGLLQSAREASCRRVFDPYAPLLFNLYNYLEQNLHFGLVLENQFWVSRGRYEWTGSTPALFQEAVRADMGGLGHYEDENTWVWWIMHITIQMCSVYGNTYVVVYMGIQMCSVYGNTYVVVYMGMWCMMHITIPSFFTWQHTNDVYIHTRIMYIKWMSGLAYYLYHILWIMIHSLFNVRRALLHICMALLHI